MMDDTISRRATIEALAGLVGTRAKTDREKALVGRCIYIVKQVPGTTCRIEEKTHDTAGGANERKD